MSTILVNSDNKNITKVTNLGFTSYTAKERKYEPQTQNTFSFQFLFDKGQVAYIATKANMQASSLAGAETIDANNSSKGLAQINEILNSSMQSISSPTKSIAQITIDFFNSQVKYAGKPTYSNANITLNTLIGLGSKNVLSAWADICLNERNLAGGWARTINNFDTMYYKPRGNMSSEEYLDYLFPYIGYKCDGLLIECARDGTIVNQWDYIGMYVSSFTPGNYSMAGANTPSQVSATITVDKIQQSDIKTVTEKITY